MKSHNAELSIPLRLRKIGKNGFYLFGIQDLFFCGGITGMLPPEFIKKLMASLPELKNVNLEDKVLKCLYKDSTVTEHKLIREVEIPVFSLAFVPEVRKNKVKEKIHDNQ